MKGFISAVTCTQRSISSVHQLIASSVHQDIIISSSMTYHSFPPFLFQLKNPASRLYESSMLIIIPHCEERSFNSKGSLTHCFAAPGWPNMTEHGKKQTKTWMNMVIYRGFLSQWLTFKLFGITYWVGKHEIWWAGRGGSWTKFKLFFSGSEMAEWVGVGVSLVANSMGES